MGIKILGWFFIAISFFLFITFCRTIYFPDHKLYTLSDSPGLLILPYLAVTTLIVTLLGFPFFLVAGIGILKIKRWAYYLALSAPFIYFMGMGGTVWVFGFQYLNRASTIPGILISAFVLVFLINRRVEEQFSANYVNRDDKANPKKLILTWLIIAILMNAIPALSIAVLVKNKFKKYNNIKPQKVKYCVIDKGFIFNNCEKINVFDYSVYIPKDWKLSGMSKGSRWSLTFANTVGRNVDRFIVLESRSHMTGLPFSTGEIRRLGSYTAYDFERRIYYPALSPIFMSLKALLTRREGESIDDVAADTWRGFVRKIKYPEKSIYDGSIYSLKGDRTCNITVFFKDGAMNAEQAKSIIASLEFAEVYKDSKALFEKGKIDLSGGNFLSASINFLNAFFINENSPEYAYYLALSLFRDNNNFYMHNRLAFEKELLVAALKLNPDYQEARELLVAVDREIEQTDLSAKKE